MRPNRGAQYEISIDGVPRTHRDQKDIALQTARLSNTFIAAFHYVLLGVRARAVTNEDTGMDAITALAPVSITLTVLPLHWPVHPVA